jgi:hypothetical protein
MTIKYNYTDTSSGRVVWFWNPWTEKWVRCGIIPWGKS